MALDRGITEDRSVELASMDKAALIAVANDEGGYESRTAIAILDDREAANRTLTDLACQLVQAVIAADMAGSDAPDGYDWSDIQEMLESLRRAEA